MNGFGYANVCMCVCVYVYVCVCLKKAIFFLNSSSANDCFFLETVIFILHVNTYLTRVVLSTVM